jgi:hypothetical protein
MRFISAIFSSQPADVQLAEVLRHSKFFVFGGVPCVLVMVRGSAFADDFVSTFGK